ncbi:hypothetical protein AB0J68_06585 [Micromonospora sp. NPDC049580]|uniref:hypothetical protein n=1 Tax=Micromonospora sp. NPDC049580 TaxID=3154832 RepID=UPI0034213C04
MAQFGNRETFALDVGEALSPSLRVVDLWAAGKMLTARDNMAYVPSLRHYIRSASARVRGREIQPCPFPEQSPEAIFRRLEAEQTEFREQYWFLRWSEIVDNVESYAYLDDDLVIVFAFRGAGLSPEDVGKVFVARVPPDNFAATLDQAADLLDGPVAT